MIYVDLNEVTVELTFALGAVDTETPPSLMLGFYRKGTNYSGEYIIPDVDVSPGSSYVTVSNVPSATFEQSGQYNFVLYDYTDPGALVEIEKGLLIATTTPIMKKEYGTEKVRGEYKGHI